MSDSQAVAHANVTLVRAYIEATNGRDFPAAMEAYADDVVLIVDARVVPTNAGTFSGRKVVGDWFADWFRSFARGYRFQIEEIQPVGDRVVMLARHHALGRTSGVTLDWSLAYVFTVEAGKIARLELYAGREEALKAVGLDG